MAVTTILIVVAVIGWLLALWFGAHLYVWADQCKHARIVVAYKRKVKIDAPLVEWLLWCRKAQKDHGARGRVVFQGGATSVAIMKAGKRRKTPQSAPRMGRYSAKDQTKPSQLSQLSKVTNERTD